MPTTLKATLRALRLTLRRTGYGPELRVNFRGGREATACYTDALDDALGTGREMARQRDAATAATGRPVVSQFERRRSTRSGRLLPSASWRRKQ